MKFTQLTLNNYKIYYGTQTMDLDIPDEQMPSQKKNLILIGGLNGAGKTTVLNAIYYVLFGKQGMSDEEYSLTFSSAVNDHFFEEGGRDSSISLSFVDEGDTVTVTVTWTFDHRKTLIRENRKVYVKNINTNTLRETNMSNEEYFDFINRRIPIEVAPFFIFDGEKIQNLVEKQDQRMMKQSIQRIVSIEVYKELVGDLTEIQNIMQRKLSTKKSDQKINGFLDEIDENKEKMDKAQHAVKKFDVEIKELEDQHMQVSQQRRRKLANNTASSIQIQIRIAEYQSKLKDVSLKLNTFAKSGLIKILLSPLIKQMKRTLEEEKHYQNQLNQAAMQFAPYDSFISKLVLAKVAPPLTPEQITKLTEEGRSIWADLNKIRQNQLPSKQVIHDISPSTRQYLTSLSGSNLQNIRELLDHKIQYERILRKEEEQLVDAPDPIDTKEEDELLNQISASLGEKKARAKQARQTVAKCRDEVENLRKKHTFAKQSIDEQTGLHQQYEFVSNIKNVAEKFVFEVTKMKAQKIKYEFKNILDRLIRKEQDFQEIEFNERDFVVRIYNDRGAEVKLSDRSAGEKQIIALSFIWALTKTAGLKLPFVIDTPLGRLDSIHRSHIIRHYFNLLSDQVIILSTDTEITDDYHEQVKDYLVRSYELVYDSENKSSQIKEGYFSLK